MTGVELGLALLGNEVTDRGSHRQQTGLAEQR
jgi:hypothetical protein